MRIQRTLVVLLATFMLASLALADTKIVKKIHQDGFSAMGQVQAARDNDQVIWMGEGRLRIDQDTSSSIVRIRWASHRSWTCSMHRRATL